MRPNWRSPDTSSIPPLFLQLHILTMYVRTPLSRFYRAPDWEWVLAIISFSFCSLTIPIIVASSIYDRFVAFVSIESILSHTWLRLVLSMILLFNAVLGASLPWWTRHVKQGWPACMGPVSERAFGGKWGKRCWPSNPSLSWHWKGCPREGILG